MTSILTVALIGAFALSGSIAEAVKSPESEFVGPTYTVSMTGYNAVPEQTDSDPSTTASGAYSNPEVVAARSIDLKEELPFGTIIEIVNVSTSSPNCGYEVVEKHLGYRVIADSMHPRKKNQVDILLANEPVVKVGGKKTNPAVALGVCKNVEIRVVGTTTIKQIPQNQAALKRVVEKQRLAVKEL